MSYRISNRDTENAPLTYDKRDCPQDIISIDKFPRLIDGEQTWKIRKERQREFTLNSMKTN